MQRLEANYVNYCESQESERIYKKIMTVVVTSKYIDGYLFRRVFFTQPMYISKQP